MNQHNRARAGGRCAVVMAATVCALWAGMGAASAQSADIVQGQLALHWGDPHPVGRMQVQRAPRLRATLVTDDGRRIPMSAAHALRAAEDLDALANRRIAVTFASTKLQRSGARYERIPEIIVPADRLAPAPGAAISASAQILPKAITGTTRWVTLMCKFADISTEQKNLAFFQGQYGSSVGQLGHYWSEVSYGQINLTGSTAHGWFLLPKPRSAYVTQVDGEDDADLDTLFQDCVTAADAQVDFTGMQGINMMFNGDLDGFAWGGSSCATFDGSRRCIRVTWNPPWSFNNVAPLAHEMGHGYGLPHSDNSDGDSDTYDNPWDVMSDAWRNAVHDTVYGSRPKHINMNQRDRLGWVNAARKLSIPASTPGVWSVELQYASLASATGRQLIVLSMPAQTGSQAIYYTLEARRRVGNYEGALAGDAVIIHRVQGGTAYSMDAGSPPADIANNEGSMFKPGETWTAADGAYWVRVDGVTAQGFNVTIGAAGQLTGGNQPARRGSAPPAQPATALPIIEAQGSAFRRGPATRRAPRIEARPQR